MQVLLVDDAAVICDRLEELLADIEQCEVVGTATTVAEAIADLPRIRPQVVILDVHLPDGDGLEVLEAAKRLVPTPVVAVLTSHSQPRYRTRYLAAGADFVWDKFRDSGRLFEALRELAAQNIRGAAESQTGGAPACGLRGSDGGNDGSSTWRSDR
jgi:two-component system, NarL family, response regulator DevR